MEPVNTVRQFPSVQRPGLPSLEVLGQLSQVGADGPLVGDGRELTELSLDTFRVLIHDSMIPNFGSVRTHDT
jgi:hypothetical protein